MYFDPLAPVDRWFPSALTLAARPSAIDWLVPAGAHVAAQALRDRLPGPGRCQAEREAEHVRRLVVGGGGDDATRPAVGVGVKPERVAVLTVGGVVEVVVDA